MTYEKYKRNGNRFENINKRTKNEERKKHERGRRRKKKEEEVVVYTRQSRSEKVEFWSIKSCDNTTASRHQGGNNANKTRRGLLCSSDDLWEGLTVHCRGEETGGHRGAAGRDSPTKERTEAKKHDAKTTHT